MEVVGGVASTVALAETGLKLFKTLHQFASHFKNASAELQIIAHNTQLLSNSVREAEKEVRWGKNVEIYSDDAVQTFNGLCVGVESSFGKVEAVVSRLSSGQRGPSFGGKMSYAFGKKGEIEELRRDLETWKTSLQIMLGVLGLSASRMSATRDEATLRAQRLEIARLMSENEEAKRRYQELVAARPTAPHPPVFVNTGSRGLDLGPSPHSHVPKRLLACAAAVARLTESIDAAIAKWDEEGEQSLDEILRGSEDVSKQVGRLMRRRRNVSVGPSSSARPARSPDQDNHWDSAEPSRSYTLKRTKADGLTSRTRVYRDVKIIDDPGLDRIPRTVLERRRRSPDIDYRREAEHIQRERTPDTEIREKRSREDEMKRPMFRMQREHVGPDSAGFEKLFLQEKRRDEVERDRREQMPVELEENLELIDQLVERWTA